MTEKLIPARLEFALWKLKTTRSFNTFLKSIATIYASIADELELDESEQSAYSNNPIEALAIHFFRDYEIESDYLATHDFHTFIQKHRKKNKLVPRESLIDLEITAQEQTAKELQKFEGIKAEQLTQAVTSITRMLAVFGPHSEHYFHNVQRDSEIMYGKNISLNDLEHIHTIIDQLAKIYTEYTIERSKYYLKESTVPGKNIEIPVEKMTEEFLHNRVRSFFTTTQPEHIFSPAAFHLHISKGIRFQLRHQLQKHSKDLEKEKALTVNTVAEKVETWYETANDIDLDRVFQLISLLNVRQQLSILFRFGYLDPSLTDNKMFCKRYQFSGFTNLEALHEALDFLITHSHSELGEWTTENSSQFIQKMQKVEPTDILRYTDTMIIDRGTHIYQLAELIAEHGDSLLQTQLPDKERRILEVLIESYLLSRRFPIEEEVGYQVDMKRGTVPQYYKSLLEQLNNRHLVRTHQ